MAANEHTEVAYLLRYADANSIFRAFRRWQRTSPGELFPTQNPTIPFFCLLNAVTLNVEVAESFTNTVTLSPSTTIFALNQPSGPVKRDLRTPPASPPAIVATRNPA